MEKTYIYQILLKGNGGLSAEWIKEQDGIVVGHGHGIHTAVTSFVSSDHWSYGLSIDTVLNCYQNACSTVTAEFEKIEWSMPSLDSPSSKRMRESMIKAINQ